jgi:hypothetical protein
MEVRALMSPPPIPQKKFPIFRVLLVLAILGFFLTRSSTRTRPAIRESPWVSPTPQPQAQWQWSPVEADAASVRIEIPSTIQWREEQSGVRHAHWTAGRNGAGARPSVQFRRDPIESNLRVKNMIDVANRETELALTGIPRGPGFCHQFWNTKQRILRDRYNVQWKSPADLNPQVRFE